MLSRVNEGHRYGYLPYIHVYTKAGNKLLTSLCRNLHLFPLELPSFEEFEGGIMNLGPASEPGRVSVVGLLITSSLHNNKKVPILIGKTAW